MPQVSNILERMRNGTMYQDKVHLRLRFRKATPEQIALFHAVVHSLDHDYPYNPLSTIPVKVMMCEKCEGVEWPRPIASLTVKVLKRIAAQLGVQMKVQRFLPYCNGTLTEQILED